MFKEVYKNGAITSKSVYEWFKRFQEGRISLEGASRAAPQKTLNPGIALTPKNIERVKQLLENDRHLTKRMICGGTGNRNRKSGSVSLILTEDLGKGKLCCRLVPHRLTPEQIEMWLGIAETSLTWQMETEIS
ncbi:hypothetical protein TNCV_2108631 [Trichonephila clavipes]|nr:hypothetical protein TNCV_2108631 [Trichonephila clavipes]